MVIPKTYQNIEPATAGSILSEDRFRAYVQCSQYYHYGGRVELDSILLRMVRRGFEGLMIQALRNEKLDTLFSIHKYINDFAKAEQLDQKYLEQEIATFKRKAYLHISTMLEKLPPSIYIPVYGPFVYRIVIQKTPIDLEISTVLKSIRKKAIQLVTFTPFTDDKDILNDPTVSLKLEALKDIIEPHNEGTQVRLHIFGLHANNELNYISTTSDDIKRQLDFVHNSITQITDGYHYPVVPCRYSCKFKKTCKVE